MPFDLPSKHRAGAKTDEIEAFRERGKASGIPLKILRQGDEIKLFQNLVPFQIRLVFKRIGCQHDIRLPGEKRAIMLAMQPRMHRPQGCKSLDVLPYNATPSVIASLTLPRN